MKNIPAHISSKLDELKEQPTDYAKCQKWLASLPEGTEFLEEPDRSSGLGWNSPALQDDLASIRSTIATAKARITSQDHLAMPGDFEAKAKRWVAGRAATVTIGMQGGRFDVRPSSEDALSLMCWLFPETVAKKLVETADADTMQQTMAHQARMRELARLQEEVLEFERREEAIVRRLLQNGVAVARRVDASPQLMLGAAIESA